MTVGTNTVSSFAYAYDALDRPVQRNADAFAYNVCGEVQSAALASAGVTNAFAY